jgi:hypothetical protein
MRACERQDADEGNAGSSPLEVMFHKLLWLKFSAM